MSKIKASRLPAIAAVVISVSASLLFPTSAKQSGRGYFAAIDSDPPPVVGQDYYIRHCLKCQRGVHETTNYWVGKLVPINTRVKLVSEAGRKLVLRIEPAGDEITVVNVEKYSRKDLNTIARELLTRTPVALDQFGTQAASMILRGQPAIGMTKEQVVMARGYPPGHRTPSLQSDIWVYWDTRMMISTCAFDNGVLTGGVKLPRLNP
ncbi:MAG: hypothetical protein ACREFX_11135 [Opitutaceae bacterium]